MGAARFFNGTAMLSYQVLVMVLVNNNALFHKTEGNNRHDLHPHWPPCALSDRPRAQSARGAMCQNMDLQK